MGRWSFSGGLDVGGVNTWDVCTIPSPELFEALVGAVGRGWGRREGRGCAELLTTRECPSCSTPEGTKTY